MPNVPVTLDSAPVLAARLGAAVGNERDLRLNVWQPLAQKLGGETRVAIGLALAVNEVLIGDQGVPFVPAALAMNVRAIMGALVPDNPEVAAEAVEHFNGMRQAMMKATREDREL